MIPSDLILSDLERSKSRSVELYGALNGTRSVW